MTDPIRAALERLLFDIRALAGDSTGVAGLHRNGDIAPWSELLEEGTYSPWLGDGMAEADAALAARAAELLAQHHPAPVPVAERPWERERWCDAEGRCWWGWTADEFCSCDWRYTTWAEIEEFCFFDAMPQVSLPAHALPLPVGEAKA
jgi:hypothetical protein